MAPQTIREAIDIIASEYQGGEIAWLEKTNPAALSQLEKMKLNDLSAVVNAWRFWIRNYKCFTNTKKKP